MRNRAKTALTGTLVLAAASLGPLGGTAHAGESSLYAPSALVLTIAHGEDASSVAPERAVTLSCEPKATGTHPSPQEACVLLGDAGGDVDAIVPPAEPELCTYQYDPVVVTMRGVWQGQRVDEERTFGNECVMRAETGAVFDF
ncbi:subtilase-type protease inhibitor [Streptomyces sp. F63]|uniref:subtilase-type protease inhibitor n=1 Tax=Streptomyces sp. F63 TaxID=2824887 RepID=UPI001B365878|nr:subtilase-type protease inhibitor [Streptomyces sp. F63]MBQ0984735.1 subtilase-type protease inhibitor [Streptomyces sp. F63]